jgi:membrane protein
MKASSSLSKAAASPPVSFTRTVMQRIGIHEVFTRSAALSYYFLLALFPLLLFLVSLVSLFAERNTQLRENIVLALGSMAPASATQLLHRVTNETFTSKHDALKLAVGIGGAFWASSGGISAIMKALNVIYDTKETRPWWKKKFVVLALTLAISALGIFVLLLALYGGKIGGALASEIGMGSLFRWAWKILQWPVSFAAMLLALSILYYFAPNLKERNWSWITPGSVAGVTLWVLASLGFRVYLHYFNHYGATYGSLGAVIILLLWLYITGFAILTGGEVNRVIETRDTERLKVRRRESDSEAGISEAA